MKRKLLPTLLLATALSCGAPTSEEARTSSPDPGQAAANSPAQSTPMHASSDSPSDSDSATSNDSAAEPELATLAAGCFWCVEAVLEQVDGVLSVTSGFMGGELENPTYKDICRGDTGHAEVVQVSFDPARVDYEDLLAWFWRLHDPTTLNSQGADHGTQYRSAIFTHSDEQAQIASASKKAAGQSGTWTNPIVTEITPASVFYIAEDYHQEYYSLNKTQPYCRAVIAPKLGKLGLDQ